MSRQNAINAEFHRVLISLNSTPQELKATPSCRWHLRLRRGDRIVALLLRRVKSLLAQSGLSAAYAYLSAFRREAEIGKIEISHRSAPAAPRLSVFALPRIPHRAGAGVGGGVRGELAVELGEQHDAIGEAKLGALRHERGILRRRGAVDDEARAGERLKQGDERRIAHPVVRPGDARA